VPYRGLAPRKWPFFWAGHGDLAVSGVS
jgi:hypothetical protein